MPNGTGADKMEVVVAGDAAVSRPTRITFHSVAVSSLTEDGRVVAKFPGKNLICAEYDPEGMLVSISAADGSRPLQEFLVKVTVESARVGRRGIVFHLDVETLLFRFDEEEAAKRFTQMVASIK